MDAPRESHDAARFLAKAVAGLSHELANCLAVINEQGGLLGDLAYMLNQGRPLDPQRLTTLGQGISRQVERGGKLAASLNRLAHVLDDPPPAETAGSLLELTLALYARAASQKRVDLALGTAGEGVPPLCAPLDFCRLIAAGLEIALKSEDSGGSISVDIRQGASGVDLDFHLEKANFAGTAGAGGEAVAAIGRELGLALTAEASGKKLRIAIAPPV